MNTVDPKLLHESREMLEERYRVRLWVWRFRYPLVVLAAAPLLVALVTVGAVAGAAAGVVDTVNYCRNAWTACRPRPVSDKYVRFIARMKGVRK